MFGVRKDVLGGGHADPPHTLALLRARHRWPRHSAAQPRDEFPPSHQRSPTAGSTAYRGRGRMSGLEAKFLRSFLQRGRRVVAHDFIRCSAAIYLLLEP
jgi:hypothetical protein